MEKINKYSKKEDYSFTMGAFPTYELILKRTELVKVIYIHDNYHEKEELISTLKEKNLAYEINSKVINRLASKENTYVMGVFEKFNNSILERSHVVLDDISDMGNLGTILRTMNAFGIRDLALVGNVCDIFNPKTIRASMGSIFDIRFEHFDTFDKYYDRFKENREIKLFMLSKNMEDSLRETKKPDVFSLVFGNEGSGLPDYYEKYGTKVFIPQSDSVDSLNLTIAVGVGLYEFTR